MIAESPLLLALQILAAGLGLTGQYFVNRRRIRGYYLWVGANIVLIPVSLYADLYVLSALYLTYLGLCVHGIMHWKGWKDSDRLTEALEKLGFEGAEARALRAAFPEGVTPQETRDLVRQALLALPRVGHRS